jgi:hypothetical protein
VETDKNKHSEKGHKHRRRSEMRLRSLKQKKRMGKKKN